MKGKRVFIAVMLSSLIAAAGVVSATAAAQEQKGPKIEIKQERYEFGNVKQGDAAVHVFEFRNAGDDILIIQKVQTS